MELLLPFAAAVLVGAGVFLVLARALIRVILGLSLISYGVNLSILLSGGVSEGAPPLLDISGPYVDPLPQALILTAIVIGFGTTALLLVLSIRAYQATGTDEVQELTEKPDPPVTVEPYADPERPSVSPERGPEEDARDEAETKGSAPQKDGAKATSTKGKTSKEVKPKKARAKKARAKKPAAEKTEAKEVEAVVKKTEAKKTTAKAPKPETSVKKAKAKKTTATKTKPKKETTGTSTAKAKKDTPIKSAKDKTNKSSQKTASPRKPKEPAETPKQDTDKSEDKS